MGHVIGLAHPFQSFSEDSEILRNNYWNWYPSPMTYYGPPNGCGLLYEFFYLNKCGIASASFTEFEKKHISDAVLASIIKNSEENYQLVKASQLQDKEYLLTEIESNIAKSKDRFMQGDNFSNEGAIKYGIAALKTTQGIVFDEEIEDGKDSITTNFQKEVIEEKIPSWIKQNAKWWADGQISDSDFVSGVQFLIKEGMISISSTTESGESTDQNIPLWVRTNAAWWAEGQISEEDFLNGIEYLVKVGIIKV